MTAIAITFIWVSAGFWPLGVTTANRLHQYHCHQGFLTVSAYSLFKCSTSHRAVIWIPMSRMLCHLRKEPLEPTPAARCAVAPARLEGLLSVCREGSSLQVLEASHSCWGQLHRGSDMVVARLRSAVTPLHLFIPHGSSHFFTTRGCRLKLQNHIRPLPSSPTKRKKDAISCPNPPQRLVLLGL